MSKITKINFDYSILEDSYPFVSTKKLLLETEHWWDHSGRKQNKGRSNYKLDNADSNGLTISLNKKLKTGIFCFLYHQNNIIAYTGLNIVNDSAWVHRLTYSPFAPKETRGSVSTFFIPYHVRHCLALGLKSYNMSFNQHNKKLYNWYKDARFRNIEQMQIGSELIHRFEFIGLRTVNYVEQWVCTLDLNRTDIDDFTKF